MIEQPPRHDRPPTEPEPWEIASARGASFTDLLAMVAVAIFMVIGAITAAIYEGLPNKQTLVHALLRLTVAIGLVVSAWFLPDILGKIAYFMAQVLAIMGVASLVYPIETAMAKPIVDWITSRWL